MKASTVAIVFLLAGAAAADVTVNTTVDADVDDAECSLREAIVAVNTNADYHGCVRSAATIDQISFDLGMGTPSITITGSALPTFTGPTIVDGQAGGATRVAILGGGTIATGLSFLGATDATGSAIRNLVVSGFTGRELLLSNASGIDVEGCFLGVDATGSSLVSGSGNGIEICTGIACGTSTTHHIGGPNPAQHNVIASGGGLAIDVNGASSVVIQGNYINTNAAGTQRVSGQFTAGIVLNNASATVIGGGGEGEGELIAGFNAVIIGGNPALARSSGTVVRGNVIGADVTGMASLSAGGDGITLSHAIDTQIGGVLAGQGNLVSGNREGITGGSSGISGGSVLHTTVQGNLIGTNATAIAGLANSSFGVNLGDDAVIGDNVIAFNGGDGLEANCGACIQLISANSIHSNGGIGIDLNGGGNGVDMNDAGDGDGGPNGRQNFPILDAVLFPGGTTISGTINSTPSTTFRVEIFANDACDPSGNGEGQEFVGHKDDVTTDANGDAAFVVTLSQTVAPGKVMTATAIAPDGSTSEFSLCTLSPPTTTSSSTSTSTSTTDSTTSSTDVSTTTSTTTATNVSTTTSTSTTTVTGAPTTSTTSTTGPIPTTSITTTTHVTTTTRLGTTTTTAPPTGCAGTPVGATFLSIDCRLDALLSRVNAETGLGTFRTNLAKSLGNAKASKLDAESLCRQADLKKAKKRLQRCAKSLGSYGHRLKSLNARKRLDDGLRKSFIADGAPIQQDVKTLRSRLQCPADAPPA